MQHLEEGEDVMELSPTKLVVEVSSLVLDSRVGCGQSRVSVGGKSLKFN